MGLLEDHVEGPYIGHLAANRLDARVLRADQHAPARPHAHAHDADLLRIDAVLGNHPVDNRRNRLLVIVFGLPNAVPVASALPRPIDRADIHAAGNVLVGKRVADVFLHLIHTRQGNDGRLEAVAGCLVQGRIGVLPGCELDSLGFHRAVRPFDHLVVATIQTLEPFDLLGLAVDRDQMLGTTETDRGAMVELACRDQPAPIFGVFGHAFEHFGSLPPRLGERAPTRDLRIDRVQILKLGPPLQPVAHDSGMQDIFIVRQHQEIVENPALIGAQLWLWHVASFLLRKRGCG